MRWAAVSLGEGNGDGNVGILDGGYGKGGGKVEVDVSPGTRRQLVLDVVWSVNTRE